MFYATTTARDRACARARRAAEAQDAAGTGVDRTASMHRDLLFCFSLVIIVDRLFVSFGQFSFAAVSFRQFIRCCIIDQFYRQIAPPTTTIDASAIDAATALPWRKRCVEWRLHFCCVWLCDIDTSCLVLCLTHHRQYVPKRNNFDLSLDLVFISLAATNLNEMCDFDD
jgi:hypothetical protein